ncbi:MAG: aldolase/citrate lyase family protein [Oscillospiraceae bacterium]
MILRLRKSRRMQALTASSSTWRCWERQSVRAGWIRCSPTHTPEDIAKVRAAIGDQAEIMARVNPLNPNSQTEIDDAIANGADVIMLPMWHTADDLRRLVSMVDGRAKVMPLLETDTAADNLPEALSIPGIDQMHIGLNDLHLCYHQKFMFQLLADGTVDRLCAGAP